MTHHGGTEFGVYLIRFLPQRTPCLSGELSAFFFRGRLMLRLRKGIYQVVDESFVVQFLEPMEIPKGQRIFDGGAVFVGGDFVAVHDRLGCGVGFDLEHSGDGIELAAQLGAIGDLHQSHRLSGGDLQRFVAPINQYGQGVNDALHITFH